MTVPWHDAAGLHDELAHAHLAAGQATPIGDRSIEAMIVSVTPDAVVGPGLVTSLPTLFAGQSAANAVAAASDGAEATRAAKVSNRGNVVRMSNFSFDRVR